MHPRTFISFLAATGLHAAGFAALDAGWLLPPPCSVPVLSECEVDVVSIVPDTPAVPLPLAPDPPPASRQDLAPVPAPVEEPPPAPKVEPGPPLREPAVEPVAEPPPEPPPPPKLERRPQPGPTLEAKPKPVVRPPAPQRVAKAGSSPPATAGSPGGGAGSRTAAAPAARSSSVAGGHGAGATLAIPGYLSNPKPAYPARAKREKQEGVVLLNVDVNAAGRVTRVEIARSSGHVLLDESALTTVRRWRFTPARLGNRPIDSRVQVPIRFQFDH